MDKHVDTHTPGHVRWATYVVKGANGHRRFITTLELEEPELLEWEGWDDDAGKHFCPTCGSYSETRKHFPDCKLERALIVLSKLRGDTDAS